MPDRKEFPWLTATLALSYVAVAHFVTGWFPTEASIEPVAFSRKALAAGRTYTIVASLFAHGGLVHLLGNLLTLLGLGRVFERELGRVRFAIVYLGAGIVGNLAHVALHPDVPIVGASGCLFGLLGVLLVLDPVAEVNLVGLPMPVVVFGGLYTAAAPFLIRFENVVPIAHEAHLGGMAFGSLFAFTLQPKRALLFAPGILATFWAIQLILVEALRLRWDLVPDRPSLLLVFVVPVVLWILAGSYIGWVYRRHAHPA